MLSLRPAWAKKSVQIQPWQFSKTLSSSKEKKNSWVRGEGEASNQIPSIEGKSYQTQAFPTARPF